MVPCAALAQGLLKHFNKCKSKRFVKVFLQKKEAVVPEKKDGNHCFERKSFFFNQSTKSASIKTSRVKLNLTRKKNRETQLPVSNKY